MKKAILINLFLVLAVALMAEPVGFNKAMKVAKRALGCEAPVEVKLSNEARSRMVVTPLKTPSFYIFNSSKENGGFAIVAGDDAFPEVLGYSCEGSIPMEAALPDGMLAYLEFLSEYISDVQMGVAAAPRKGASTEGVPVVAPLVSSQWGQDSPYNLMCPKVGGVYCDVGCVATAMAQVMRMWRWPEHGRGVMSYAAEGIGVLSVNFENSVYDWNNMYDTALQNAKNQARKDAVAKLSYDCGVASRMAYGTRTGSGTRMTLARIALGRYLGYAASQMEYYDRDCYNGEQENWNEMIWNELNEGRPVLYAAYSSANTSGKDAGHCFILDGYDSNGYVHVNWGWNGAADGYYAITVLDPDGAGYVFSESQEIIIGIQPDYEWNDDKEGQLPMHMYEPFSIAEEKAALGAEFTAEIYDIYNLSGLTGTYYIGVGLYDKMGHLVDVVGEAPRASLGDLYGYGEMKLPCRIPVTCPSGDYVLRVINKQYSSSVEYDWVEPYTYGGAVNNQVAAYVYEGVVYFNQVSTHIDIVNANDEETVKHEYFDISGKKLQGKQRGIVIDRQVLPNGKSVYRKVMMR